MIARLTEASWLTLIVDDPWRLRDSVALSTFRVHTEGIWSLDGLGDGDGDGVGVGVGVGVGSVVGFGSVVGLGSEPVSTGSGCVPGSVVTGGVVVTGSPGVVVVIGVVVVVVVVPFDARSATLRVTLGTSSSKTALLMVISPAPVTSIETISVPPFSLIETDSLGKVNPF